jgi:RNA polymerase sigma-70 factor, ECF subfamily
VARLHRERWGASVALLARTFRDLELAEDGLQEAHLEALRRWPEDGVPRNPTGWLLAVARNRILDRVRRDRRFAARVPELERAAAERLGDEPVGEALDDQLAMLLACCHPALAMEARVALTLRLVAGLTTAEIARAYLVPEATMAQRLVRAKRRVREAGIPLAVPEPALLGERLDGARRVLYLVFNEAYAATTDSRVVRSDLASEAIRLGRLLLRLAPGEAESEGLLALMLLQHSRRDARLDAVGRLVLLEDQDRGRWHQREITSGIALLERALARRRPGRYQLQAAIAAVHARSPSAEATDWAQIVALYDRLLELWPSPVVALNRAVAVAMRDGPLAALPLVETLAADPRLAGYHLLPAVEADLLRRLGRREEAAACYRRAIELATNPTDRAFLEGRLVEVEG